MQPMEIIDTQHMSHFVSAFYKSNLNFMRQRDMPVNVEQDVEMEETAPATTEAEEQVNHMIMAKFIKWFCSANATKCN